MNCTCIHDFNGHDPVSGACLFLNPAIGPCPCEATPQATEAAQQYVFETYLHPEYDKLRQELRKKERDRQRGWQEMAKYASILLHGSDEDVAAARAEAARIDRLLMPTREPS